MGIMSHPKFFTKKDKSVLLVLYGLRAKNLRFFALNPYKTSNTDLLKT